MAFISEIHYQNNYASNSGQSEFVEIRVTGSELAAMSAGDSTFQVTFYQQNGTVEQIVTLDPADAVRDPNTGAYSIIVPGTLTAPTTNPPDASEPEAVALTRTNSDGTVNVLKFVEIAPSTGAITATEGPASGSTAQVIAASSNGQSVQYDKNGNRVDGPVSPNQAICFTLGTLIETEHGALPIENLKHGARVRVRDNGFQPIRWIGRRRLDAVDLARSPKLRPILIRAGSLGAGTPTRDLTVSPQHRILVRSKIAQRMFGAAEVLVAAKQLCSMNGIDVVEDASEVTYFHILFDRHEIVFANGAEAESLFTGPEAINSVGKSARQEIFTIFPQLRWDEAGQEPARPVVTGRRARDLAARHMKNRRSLIVN
ncbi:Hint domain-containing protein [Paracoccus aurantiacus]|uniref:Hint domain-containing protein n=1 Tax=Paracoccus aurantiacus TaxID=2599412 RepID=A0A5C6S8U3_9RHOB|nr:Hint domain-containing protein [Paracoccus aurantiacus]TXB70891.1 Hint domain-containing protein [Paracoccus aurantiacus]